MNSTDGLYPFTVLTQKVACCLRHLLEAHDEA